MKDFNADKYVADGLAQGLCTDPADFEKAEAAIKDILEYCKMPSMPIHRAASPGVLTSWSKTLFGCAWSAGWVAMVNCLHEECGWNGNLLPVFRMEERLAQSCFLVEFGDEAITIIDRPERIRMQDGVLHCEDGPSILFRDGWAVYSWRGTRVPAEWIMGKPTVEDALHHDNTEMRRCAAEIIGWNVVLDELNARTISKHPNPMIGEVVEVEIPDIGRERFLRAMCGTRREFAMPIPPDISDPEKAQAFVTGEDQMVAFRT